VTGIVVSAVCAGAIAVAGEQSSAHAFDPAMARAAASQPARLTVGVSSALKWSSMMRYFAEGLRWTLGAYALVSVVSLAMTRAVVHYSVRKWRDNAGSSKVLPPAVMTGVAKATAVSMSPALWGVLVFVPLWCALAFVSYPVLFRKVPSSVFFLLDMLFLPVWGLGCLWAIVFSVLCGLRIARHLRRIRCVSCGYDLKGTLGDRCSECGMDLEIVSDA